MNKLAKVRAEIERIQLYSQSETLKQVLDYIDTVQKEPVSEDLGQAIDAYLATYFGSEKEKQEWPFLKKMAIYFAKWQRQKDSIPVNEELEDTTQTITYKGEVYTRCYKDKLDAFACKYPMLVPKPSKRYAKYSDVDLIIAVKKGAQWQKEQDQSTIELAEDHAMLAGMEKMKEQMMANAIDGEVLENYDGKVLEYDDSILDEKLSDCKVFDKVKIVVIKED